MLCLHSPLFQSMLSLPQSDDHNREGADDDNPIILAGYASHDFELMLDVLYSPA